MSQPASGAPTKVLAIHSFAVHGMASMKTLQSILGSRLLPVPSLLLSGLTNIPGHVKVPLPFEALLKSSLEIGRRQGQQIMLYIGYLGAPEQVPVIRHLIDQYRQEISLILVDPVAGDHGRLYVPEAVISVWPELLALADWAFPNYTELQLFSGEGLGVHPSPEIYLTRFRERFPRLNFLATSLPDGDQLGIALHTEQEDRYFCHERVAHHFGGTGDLFAGLFMLHHFFHQHPVGESILLAAQATHRVVSDSYAAGSKELLIYPTFPS